MDETTPAAAAWWQLSRAFLALRLTLRRSLASAGIALAHAEALTALQSLPDADAAPMTATRLARALGVEPYTLTALVDELEQRGWVRRQRDRADRRVVRLELTAAGVAKAAEAQPRLEEAQVRCFAGLTVDELRELIALLARLMPADEPGTATP